MVYGIATTILSCLPLRIQEYIHTRFILKKSMRFNVEPLSLWVAYEARPNDPDVLDRIPPGMEWCAVSVFPDEPPRKYLFFNFFRVDSTYMTGHRLEVVATVRPSGGGEPRFLILEYFTDTISSDPNHLFRRPDRKDMRVMCTGGKRTATYTMGSDYFAKIQIPSLMTDATLAPRFVEANKEIYYSRSSVPNLLIFDPSEVGRVITISQFCIVNDIWKDSRSPIVSHAFLYPHPVSFTITPA